MRTSSAKAKGRRLVQKVKEMLLSWAPDLKEDDFVVTSSGCTGEDLMLSPAAKAIYPLVFEMKNQEKINIWESYAQACSHLKDDRKPVLVYSRNHSEVMITLKMEDFLHLIR